LATAAPNDPTHTTRVAADASRVTDKHTDRQTPRTSVRIARLSFIFMQTLALNLCVIIMNVPTLPPETVSFRSLFHSWVSE